MIIMDLDGCAADDRHRVQFVKQIPKDYNAYHALMHLDPPINKEIWQGRSDVIVLTGRPNNYFPQTTAWMEDHGMECYYMLMRPQGNVESAVDLKRRWAENLIREGLHIDKAYDDREDIVAAYRKLGIEAYVMDAGGLRGL